MYHIRRIYVTILVRLRQSQSSTPQLIVHNSNTGWLQSVPESPRGVVYLFVFLQQIHVSDMGPRHQFSRPRHL